MLTGMAKSELEAQRAYIDLVAKKTGWDYSTIARKAGLATTTITRPMGDPAYEGAMRVGTIAKVAAASRVAAPPDLLRDLPGTAAPPAPPAATGLVETPIRFMADQDMSKARPINHPDNKTRDLPVVGTAMGGPNGYFEMQGSIIEHVWRPPHLASVANAFALYVAGSSMEPRYEEGELIYCRPGRRPRPRNYVVLEMHQEHDGDPIMAMIGRYKRQTDTFIEIEKLNPPQTQKVPAGKVRRIHIISGTGPAD